MDVTSASCLPRIQNDTWRMFILESQTDVKKAILSTTKKTFFFLQGTLFATSNTFFHTYFHLLCVCVKKALRFGSSSKSGHTETRIHLFSCKSTGKHLLRTTCLLHMYAVFGKVNELLIIEQNSYAENLQSRRICLQKSIDISKLSGLFYSNISPFFIQL